MQSALALKKQRSSSFSDFGRAFLDRHSKSASKTFSQYNFGSNAKAANEDLNDATAAVSIALSRILGIKEPLDLIGTSLFLDVSVIYSGSTLSNATYTIPEVDENVDVSQAVTPILNETEADNWTIEERERINSAAAWWNDVFNFDVGSLVDFQTNEFLRDSLRRVHFWIKIQEKSCESPDDSEALADLQSVDYSLSSYPSPSSELQRASPARCSPFDRHEMGDNRSEKSMSLCSESESEVTYSTSVKEFDIVSKTKREASPFSVEESEMHFGVTSMKKPRLDSAILSPLVSKQDRTGADGDGESASITTFDQNANSEVTNNQVIPYVGQCTNVVTSYGHLWTAWAANFLGQHDASPVNDNQNANESR